MKTNLNIDIAVDEYGKGVSIDLDSIGHLLIAGCAGSGKSNLIHKIVSTIIENNSPDKVKFIFIDPKKVELAVYSKIPHSLTEIIGDSKKTILVMKWVSKEMDRRKEILKKEDCRNISEYKGKEEIPKMVVVIDELSTSMGEYPKEVGSAVSKVAETGHLVGVHVLISTSKGTSKVLTKDIQNAISARIAFQATSKQESNIVIGNDSALSLHGVGDMLYRVGMKYVIRGKTELVEYEKIKSLCKSLKEKYQQDGFYSVYEAPEDDLEDDDMYEEAKEITIKAGKASASYLQRILKIGYSRAASLIDLLEDRGVIGPADGAKPRNVLK